MADFFTLPTDGNGNAVQAMRPGASQSVGIGAASAQSTALTNSEVVRVAATADCFIAVGTNPTAVASTTMFLPAGMPEYIHITKGDKIAAIQATSGGSLYITEMN